MTSYKHKKADVVYVQAVALPKEVYTFFRKQADKDFMSVASYIRRNLIIIYNGTIRPSKIQKKFKEEKA